MGFEKVPDSEPKILSGAEMKKILDACKTPRHRWLFDLMAYTGMRRAELTNLMWSDVDFAANTMKFHGQGVEAPPRANPPGAPGNCRPPPNEGCGPGRIALDHGV